MTSEVPLLGRLSELDDLARLAGLTGEDPARAVILAGDAGVGKTRLLTELTSRAESAGLRVLIGHCTDLGEGALPFLPFSEVLGRLAAGEPGRFTALTTRHPALSRLLPGRRDLTSAADADEESVGVDRAHVFDAVHGLLDDLADDQGLLLVVEDLHWADASTRDLLTLLFARGFTRRVCIVASYRSDDLHRRHPLRARAAEWGRMPGVVRMPLEPLADADVRRLVRAVRPGLATERAFGEIIRRAEGNPFFAEELALASGAGTGALPTDLADLLLVRLDRLDGDARAVVRAASCSGSRVTHEMLAAVVGIEEDALDRALHAVLDANVLVPSEGTSYAFRHALLAEAVHDDLLPGERRRLHAAHAAALKEGHVSGSAAELAHHALAAQDLPTAVAAFLQAGDDAMTVGGPDEAAGHYLRVLDLLGRPDAPHVDVTELTVKAADALLAAGHASRAADITTDQLRRVPPGDAVDRVPLLLSLAAAVREIESETSGLDLTTEALSLVGEEATPSRARALIAHAYTTYDRGRDSDATRFAEDALALAEQLHLPRVASEAATLIGRLKERAGDPEGSLAALDEVTARARADGDVIALVRALHQTGTIHFESGNLTRARELYLEAAAVAAEHGRTWSPSGFDARLLACLTAYMTGDWDAVGRETDLTGGSPPPLVEAVFHALALAPAAGRGDDGAAEILARVRPWWHEDGLVCVLSAGAAIDLHGDRGDIDTAIDLHNDAVRTLTRLWHAEQGLFQARVRFSAVLLGQLAAEAGRPGGNTARLVDLGAVAADAAELTVERATASGRPYGIEGRAWRARARAEHLRLRWTSGVEPPAEADLVDAWERTVELFTQLGHPFERARSEARLAHVLRAAGRPDDASQVAVRARDTARRLRAAPLLTELAHLARTAPARPGPTDELTPRELEVLALVAQGQSNGQIARRLFISPKTASVHVSNILAKLGASGRTEAAAVAHRRGLLRT